MIKSVASEARCKQASANMCSIKEDVKKNFSFAPRHELRIAQFMFANDPTPETFNALMEWKQQIQAYVKERFSFPSPDEMSPDMFLRDGMKGHKDPRYPEHHIMVPVYPNGTRPTLDDIHYSGEYFDFWTQDNFSDLQCILGVLPRKLSSSLTEESMKPLIQREIEWNQFRKEYMIAYAQLAQLNQALEGKFDSKERVHDYNAMGIQPIQIMKLATQIGIGGDITQIRNEIEKLSIQCQTKYGQRPYNGGGLTDYSFRV